MPADILRTDAAFARFARFAIIGGLSTVVHALLTWGLHALLHVSPAMASAAGYVLAIPPNFLLQRGFAFRADHATRRQLPRFLLLHATCIACSAGIMRWTLDHGWSYGMGIVLVMVTIPCLSFVVMNTWVFSAASGDHPKTPGKND